MLAKHNTQMKNTKHISKTQKTLVKHKIQMENTKHFLKTQNTSAKHNKQTENTKYILKIETGTNIATAAQFHCRCTADDKVEEDTTGCKFMVK